MNDSLIYNDYISTVHNHLKSLKADGVLSLLSVGEINNQKIPNKIEHFTVEDEIDFILTIDELKDDPGRNIYLSTAIYRKDLPAHSKGGEDDIVGVFALVLDFDDDNAVNWKNRIPIEPTMVLETSPGRFQVFYFFNCLLEPGEAKQFAVSLKNYTQCDACAKDISHAWRIPGLYNWPNNKKLREGRSPNPYVVKVIKKFSSEDVLGVNDLLPVLPQVCQDSTEYFNNLNLKRAEKRTNISHDSKIDISLLPEKLQNHIIHGVVEGERSDKFFHVVAELYKLGHSVDTIADILLDYPDGIANKYASRNTNKFYKQIENCFKKLDQQYPRGIDQFDVVDIGEDHAHAENILSTKSKSTNLMSLSEFLNRPTPPFLIEGMIPQKGVGIVAGRSGTYKTFIVANLGVHVAYNMLFNGNSIDGGDIWYFANEGADFLGKRFAGLLKYYDLENNNKIHISDICPYLNQKVNIQNAIEELKKQSGKPKLIIIDTLSKSIPGADENSAKDVSEALNAAYRLSQEFDCFVLIVDHTPKANNEQVRGSSVKRDNVDFLGIIKRNGKQKLATLTIDKLKDAEDGKRYMFEAINIDLKGHKQPIPVLIPKEDLNGLTQEQYVLIELSGFDDGMSRDELKNCFKEKYPDKLGNLASVLSRMVKNGSIIKDENGIYKILD
jgi:hypothetical protein